MEVLGRAGLKQGGLAGIRGDGKLGSTRELFRGRFVQPGRTRLDRCCNATSCSQGQCSHDNGLVVDPLFPAAEGDMALQGNEKDFSGAFCIFRRQLEDLIGEVDQVLAKMDEGQCFKGLAEFCKVDQAEILKEKSSKK